MAFNTHHCCQARRHTRDGTVNWTRPGLAWGLQMCGARKKMLHDLIYMPATLTSSHPRDRNAETDRRH